MEDDDLEQLLLNDFQSKPRKSTFIQQPPKQLIQAPVKINVEDYDDDIDAVKTIELNNKLRQLKLEIQDLKTNPNIQSGDQILRKDFLMETTLVTDKKLMIKIKCLNGFIKGLRFQQQLYPYFQKTLTDTLLYQIRNQFSKNQIQGVAYVTSHPGREFELRSFSIKVPKFYKWVRRDKYEQSQMPEGLVRFVIRERAGRFLNWLETRLVLSVSEQERKIIENENKIDMLFVNSFQSQFMLFRSDGSKSTIEIRCDNISELGSMIQNLADYCNIPDLQTQTRFPKERTVLIQKLNRIQQISKNKTNLASDMADTINLIKQLIVQSENSRITSEILQMKKNYMNLLGENKKLFVEDKKRNLNTAQLQKLLKEIGISINNFSNLRVGKYKAEVVALCRNALKNKQFAQLIDIFERGSE